MSSKHKFVIKETSRVLAMNNPRRVYYKINGVYSLHFVNITAVYDLPHKINLQSDLKGGCDINLGLSHACSVAK